MTDNQLLKLNAALLGLVAAMGAGAALYLARPVILPFVIAIFAAFAVEPVIRVMQKLYIPRWLGALGIVGMLFVTVQTTVAIVARTAAEFEKRLPVYLETLQRFVDDLPLPSEALSQLSVNDPAFWTELMPLNALAGSVGSWAQAVTSLVAQTMLVLLITVAMIIARRSLDERLNRAAESATGRAEQTARIIGAIDDGIQKYMALKTVLSVAFGVCMWAALTALEVDFAVLWGFLAFLLNFIPTVGPAVATAPGVGLIWLQYGDRTGYALFGTALTVSIPFLYGNIIEPKVFGDSLNLNFFAVLFALMLWSFIWGLPGAVLSVPIMMAISVVCREVPAMRLFHELLRA